MTLLWIGAGILAVLVVAFFVISYICFRMAFYVPDRKPEDLDAGGIPQGKIYEPYREAIERWTAETRQMPHQQFTIKTFDGLTLYGKFYEYKPGAPIELMFHGYRGNAQRDLSGGVQRCFRLGRSALIVDQRCSERSDGNVITFGIHEHKDCLCCEDFMVKHFGTDVKIILTGISMGASTVLMAAGHPLPDNVIGVLADCGFNSAKDIIQKVIVDMKLPAKPGYFFVKAGARIFGHFDLEEYSAEEAMKTCTKPVIFFHGDNDHFVPWEMSKINYDACASEKKRLVVVPGAGHGLSYLIDQDRCQKELRDFVDYVLK